MADGDLPPREERGDVQPAGCGQHGRCLLHAGGRHGSIAHHLHLRTLVLLAAALLLHGRLLRPARLRLLHQQGETGRGREDRNYSVFKDFRADVQSLVKMDQES